jgi:hypothetical protein
LKCGEFGDYLRKGCMLNGNTFPASKILFYFKREPSRLKFGVTAVQDLQNQKKAGKLSSSN